MQAAELGPELVALVAEARVLRDELRVAEPEALNLRARVWELSGVRPRVSFL